MAGKIKKNNFAFHSKFFINNFAFKLSFRF